MLKTKGSWYPKEVIVHAVYLKLRFSLSYRDIEEILKDRGLGRPMLGFKSLVSASITLAGIEVVMMLRKGQSNAANMIGMTLPERFRLLAV